MLLFVRYVFNFKGYPTFVYQSRKNTSFLRVEFSDNGISFHSTCHKIHLLHLSTNILCKLFHHLCSLPLYSISNSETIPMIRAYLTSHPIHNISQKKELLHHQTTVPYLYLIEQTVRFFFTSLRTPFLSYSSSLCRISNK